MSNQSHKYSESHTSSQKSRSHQSKGDSIHQDPNKADESGSKDHSIRGNLEHTDSSFSESREKGKGKGKEVMAMEDASDSAGREEREKEGERKEMMEMMEIHLGKNGDMEKEKMVYFDPEFVQKHFGIIKKERLEKLRNTEWTPVKGKKAAKAERRQKAAQEVIDHFNTGDFSFVEREEKKEEARAKFGIRISFAFNVLLTIIKVVVLSMTGSISVFASLLDSILDLISGSIIFVANRLQILGKKEYYKYPVGKRRLETLSVIVFSAAMFTATGELLIRSVERIVDPNSISLSFDYVSIALMTAIIIIKFGLWILCRRAAVPTVQALAQDHINDVFTNSVGSLFALLGYYFWPLLDPIGGLCLGLFIMVNWAQTGIENVRLMTGISADPEFLSLLTALALKHDDRIVAIDTVRAYFVSNRMMVELDILLPEDMSLKEAHDIGESLQNKIEKLPDIERAFVHLDFEFEHKHLDEHPTLRNLHSKFHSKDFLVKLEESGIDGDKK